MPLKRDRHRGTKTHTQKKILDDRDRDWNDAATSQKDAKDCQQPPEAKRRT